ncbi:pre-mRNA-processing factor 6, putative [Babesia caballi]|uniref:Pre-mRNA-processing factor 6, putative n=1 Tax=Babesia caballi TaxID=5871 RepID=A0AAV4LRU3_BABCB|nr:pre-mRNA-processing factor 6, putative [Babesia caballi]
MSLLPGARKFVPPPASSEPSHYAPGAGRGATAFTTRADFGYAAAATLDPFGKPPPGYVPGRGRGATSFAGGISRDDVADSLDRSAAGGEDTVNLENERLFHDAEYDEEDQEADLIYEAIDARMDERRRSRRETKIKDEVTRQRAEKPTIQQQLAPLKRDLESLTMEEWESIPAIGDYSLKRKQQNKRQAHADADGEQRGHGDAAGLRDAAGDHGRQRDARDGRGDARALGGDELAERPGAGEGSGALADAGQGDGQHRRADGGGPQGVPDGPGVDEHQKRQRRGGHQEGADAAQVGDRDEPDARVGVDRGGASGGAGGEDGERAGDHRGGVREVRRPGGRVARGGAPGEAGVRAGGAGQGGEDGAQVGEGVGGGGQPGDQRQRQAADPAEGAGVHPQLGAAVEGRDLAGGRVERVRDAEARSGVRDGLGGPVAGAGAALPVPGGAEGAERGAEAAAHQPRNLDHGGQAGGVQRQRAHGTCGRVRLHAVQVEKIIARGLDNLARKGVIHVRANWLKHAEQCESNEFVATARAIVKCTMKVGVDESMLKTTWLEDGERFEERGLYACARAVYRNALDHMKTKTSLWLALAELETKHGSPAEVDAVLTEATRYCPNSEILWLMAAKHRWVQGDVEAARRTLGEAYAKNKESEAISLAAVKLEREHEEFDRAREFLERARGQCGTRKVWMQSVQLERQLGNHGAAAELCQEALRLHPSFDKLWMIAGQLRLEKPESELEEAVRIFHSGTEQCPWSVPLWLLALEALMRHGEHARARARADVAKTKVRSILGPRLKHSEKVATVNTKRLSHSELVRVAKAALGVTGEASSPHEDLGLVEELVRSILRQCDLLWLRAVEIELEAGNAANAYFMMSTALQEFPDSGNLWARAVFMEERSAQNAKAVDALNQCQGSALVVLAAARLFWRDRKTLKARKWFKRALAIEESNGVAWGTFLAFELENRDAAAVKEVVNGCAAAEPDAGYDWCRVVKRVANWRLSWPHKLYRFVEEYYGELLVAALEWLPSDVRAVLVPGSAQPEGA